jgi:acetylornithine deacetylase
MHVATGHKGKVSYLVKFTGEAGHSAKAPEHLNALHLATDFVAILRRIQEEIAERGTKDASYSIPYSTIHVGRLSGGTALNVVPSSAELEFEIRHLASDDVAGLINRISDEADRIVAKVAADHPAAKIEIAEANRYPGFDLARDSDAARFMLSLGAIGPVTKVDYGTDGGVLATELGVPVIVCGPGDMQQGHKPDEFIEVSQLNACDLLLDRIIGRLSTERHFILM